VAGRSKFNRHGCRSVAPGGNDPRLAGWREPFAQYPDQPADFRPDRVVQLLQYPIDLGIVYTGEIAVMCLAAWLFLAEAEIVVDDTTVAKRNLFEIWRRAALAGVAGIGFRRIGIKHVEIVYRRDRRSIFWITSNVWDRHGLEALAQRLGGSSVERASTYTDINREFPGTFPQWFTCYERHPMWTIGLLVIGVLVVCVLGMMVANSSALGTSGPRLEPA